ncbi:unnamed protein product [Coregonus sp. 'balchen']|nr:unnamed protein product [Coregonus sp. 'balchen']
MARNMRGPEYWGQIEDYEGARGLGTEKGGEKMNTEDYCQGERQRVTGERDGGKEKDRERMEGVSRVKAAISKKVQKQQNKQKRWSSEQSGDSEVSAAGVKPTHGRRYSQTPTPFPRDRERGTGDEEEEEEDLNVEDKVADMIKTGGQKQEEKEPIDLLPIMDPGAVEPQGGKGGAWGQEGPRSEGEEESGEDKEFKAPLSALVQNCTNLFE